MNRYLVKIMIEIVYCIPDDFKSYFKPLCDENIHLVKNPDIKKIYVTAGPYRPYGACISWIDKSKGELNIDFYAALRVGFGSLDFNELFIALNDENEIAPGNELFKDSIKMAIESYMND